MGICSSSPKEDHDEKSEKRQDGKEPPKLAKKHTDIEVKQYGDEENLKELFLKFDTTGDSKISGKELGTALRLRGLELEDEEVKQLIAEVDKDGDRELDFAEFSQLMRKLESKKAGDDEKLAAELDKEYEEEQTELASLARSALSLSYVVDDDKSPHIVVGPIIGKVTDTTARILIETSADCAVTCVYVCQESGDRHEAKREFKKGVPGVFQLKDLGVNHHYEIAFDGEDFAGVVGSFRTMDPKQRSFNVVAAACDKGAKHRGKVNLFEKLYSDYIEPRRLDLLIRHGDQVYADVAFKQCEVIMADEKMPQAEKDQKMLDAYKAFYRRDFAEPDVRRVMANVSTLMIWDDHEVRNDWGTFKQDRDKSSKDFKIARFARQAFREYQRQLWDDLGPREGAALEAHVRESSKWLTQGPLTSLTLSVDAGRQLLGKDGVGKSDPYLAVEYLDKNYEPLLQAQKSKRISNTVNPKWDFKAPKVSADVLAKVFAIRIQVWDHDAASNDDFMGELLIPLRLNAPLPPGVDHKQWLPLKPSTDFHINKWNEMVTGEIEVCLRYDRKAGDEKRAGNREEDGEGSLHVYGNFGVVLLDGRGARSFSVQEGRDPREAFLGTQQWVQLRSALAPDGMFQNVSALLLVHTMAPILMATSDAFTIGHIPPQVDKMGFSLHPQEQCAFLQMLDTWAVSSKRRRCWFLVGGDMHFGVLTDIATHSIASPLAPPSPTSPTPAPAEDKKGEKKGSPPSERLVGQQMITSAISNSPPPSAVYWMLRRFMKGQGTLGHPGQEYRFKYQHQQFVNERNFGLVMMGFSSEHGGTARGLLVSAKTEPPSHLDRAC